MKLSHLFLISILLCAVLVVPVSADAFSAWSVYGDAWRATNDTYTILKWNTTGTHTWVSTGNTTSLSQYLVVGGGGSSGQPYGGGGGAGGFLTGTSYSVSGNLNVLVGAGGLGTDSTFGSGQNSSFANTTAGNGINAKGGGSGSHYNSQDAQIGGSGGGGGYGAGGYGTATGAAGISGQGNKGGNADGTDGYGAGGGAGAVGADGSAGGGGAGGAGLQSNITGVLTWYAAGGGGGGSNANPGGTGGSGIGGNGATASGTSTAGTPETGSGAGGGGSGAYHSGGSGVVIILYLTPPSPVASFTPLLSSGVSPYGVSFTDTSTNTPTYWNWTIEGKIGNTTKYLNVSTSQNPSFSFLQGNFSISLGAGNANGFDISDQHSWVNVSFGGPVVAFTTNVTVGVNPLALYLNDTSTGTPTMWNTSWGDLSWTNQTLFPATNITHIYSTAGTYWINEYATNAYGTANGTPLLITVYSAAHSDFTAWNTAGNAPHTTYLYDTSTNLTPGADTYYWMFGDGNTSTSQYLYYTWNITGTYSVNHSFSNGLSTSWNNKSAYVTVGSPEVTPVASFYGGPQIGAPPMLVYLTDVSTHTPTSWNWSFGDGLYSVSQNPSHWYNSSGFFTVNLTATNGAGSNTLSQTNFVMVY